MGISNHTFRVEGGIDIMESFIREGINKKIISQAGPWYNYKGAKSMGLNGIKTFFVDNPDSFEQLKNEVLE